MRDPDSPFCWLPEFEPDPYEARAEEITRAGEFGAIRQGNAGETLSYAALAPAALEAHEQLDLDLAGYSHRRAVRVTFADRIERIKHRRKYLESWPDRLRMARTSAHSGIRMNNGKPIVIWDHKAGLSRICPDDAREEAMRLQRKNVPHCVALQESGHTLFYSVLTTPNAARGDLRDGMDGIYDRLKRLLKAKDADGELLFPEIKGALCVLEAPLGRSRDWNVHLNVILVVKGQWLNWEKLRSHWHWDLHIKKLPKGEEAIRAALTELIKYAVAATVAKSARRAADEQEQIGFRSSGSTTRSDAGNSHERSERASSHSGSDRCGAADALSGADYEGCAEHGTGLRGAAAGDARAPPMLEWTDDELLEWFDAFQGFRRTRSYGAMYGVEKPEPEELGPIVWIGTINLRGGRYVHSCPLLRSIPEDKFSGLSATERWQALVKALAPGGLMGAGSIGEHAPRIAELLA